MFEKVRGMNFIKDILGEFRQQSLAIWLSIAGTALAVFTVMAVFIIAELPETEVKPESCRKSLLIGNGIDFVGENGSGTSAGLSKKWAEKFYGNLEGIEKTAFFSLGTEDISVPGQPVRSMTIRYADDRYWDLFDFDFICGKPYTGEEIEKEQKVAVLSETTARTLFGTPEAVGKEFTIGRYSCVVRGVVKDVNTLFTLTFGEIYLPMNYGFSWGSEGWMTEYLGHSQVVMLKKPGVSDESVKAQVKARYDVANKDIIKRNWELVWHESPYNIEEYEAGGRIGITPDVASSRRIRWLSYTILLLIPAINLSGMSCSRLRHRVSEIGVRRAFGATGIGVFGRLLFENFCITFLGGAIGLGVCILAVYLFANLFVNMTIGQGLSAYQISGSPTFEMIFTWRVFAFALIFCFFLNLFSSGIPVWKAISVKPAEAIAGKRIQ